MRVLTGIAPLLFLAGAWTQLWCIDFEETPPTFSSEVELVLLDVSVKDSDGRFVSGLTEDDFIVTENGVPQKITSFVASDAPVTVGLVVDMSGSMTPKRYEVIRGAIEFVRASNPEDEVFVVNFNDAPWLGLPEGTPFSFNIDELRGALSLKPPQGRTALYDALSMGLKHLEQGRQEKKALVVISDGGDNASQLSFAEALRQAQESMATIYTIGIYDLYDKDRNPGVLKELSRTTGGEAFFPKRVEEVLEACQKIAKDIRNRYTIGYVPHHAKHDGSFHKIRVGAVAKNRGKLTVRTRAGYYLPAEQSAKTQ
ncbi:MAG: VWA domain-containing protein [Bryobacteraceae bacterium]|nr:VWA domain-containing protein [Bryobacterales bacterium]MEB2359787.1 VWA domain-containing protein [Bryobacterales bacterium]NUM99754.1 VWA domain-containing protein [Bryobacteraceae bacterium]